MYYSLKLELGGGAPPVEPSESVKLLELRTLRKNLDPHYSVDAP